MANNTNNVNEILKDAQRDEPKLSAYATNAMRPVIIQKAIDGKRRAINEKMCEACGVSKERLGEWRYNIQKLYEAACAYSKGLGGKDEEELRGECLAVWKQIINVGEEDIFHPNMFIRDKDVENLRVLAAESDEVYIKGVGFVGTVKGVEAFRSKIEVRLALRIAGNKTLNDRQRQVITEYQSATNTIKKCNQFLNGYQQGDKMIPGVGASIAKISGEVKAMITALKAAGIEDVKKYVQSQVQQLANLKEQKEDAEKRIKNAEKVINKHKEAYNEIIDTLDAIEGANEKTELPDEKVTYAERLEAICKDLGI